MTLTIYHNPRCTKSRRTLALIQERGLEPRVVHYLETPPDPATFAAILAKLGVTPLEIVRKGEAEYASARVDEPGLTDAQIIDRILAHPQLIERPIVVTADAARIGRPPENVLEIL